MIMNYRRNHQKFEKRRHAELVSKFGRIAVFVLFSLFFISCTTEVTLSVQADNSIAIKFDGGAGEAFSKMISSAAGMGGESENLIDTEEVSYELAKAGFSDVKINQKNGGAVSITMSDKKQTSYIFTSGIAKCEKGKLSAVITRKSLEDFYASADEQTRMILDLFLAPVFNNEEMTEEEYLEIVASFYGAVAAKEVAGSFVKINLISKDGKKESLNYPLTQVFCGLTQ